MKDIKTLVQEMINAHSCYPALKEAGQEYLDSIGSKNEKEAARKLIEYTQDCVE